MPIPMIFLGKQIRKYNAKVKVSATAANGQDYLLMETSKFRSKNYKFSFNDFDRVVYYSFLKDQVSVKNNPAADRASLENYSQTFFFQYFCLLANHKLNQTLQFSLSFEFFSDLYHVKKYNHDHSMLVKLTYDCSQGIISKRIYERIYPY